MSRTNLDDKAKLKLYFFKAFHFLLTCGLFYVVWLQFRYGKVPQVRSLGFRYNYLVTAGFALLLGLFTGCPADLPQQPKAG